MGKKGVLKKAKKLELKGTQENKINSDVIPALEEILHDVYAICRPRPIDYFNRKDLVRIFNVIAREIYGNSDDIPVVEEFGSFLMDIFSAKSDLDVSVNFGNKEGDFPQEKKIQSLRKFAKKLYALRRKGHVSSLQPILTAKVPILKIVDRGTGIECDISIENRDGILKSQIVRMICSIDERFQMLCFLVKVWAKAHGINSSKDRTLNSLSIISLVAFHLQTRDPPILPPFSALFKDGIDPEPVGKILDNFLDFGKMNKESLGELFVTLLVKLASVETLWPKGLCASIYDGSWIYRTWESTSRKKLDSKFGCISVEDFTDRSLNVARAVGKKQVGKIYKIIHLSVYYISAFMDGQIQGTKLRELLFGRECMPSLEDKSVVDGTVVADFSLDPTMTKKTRRTGGLGETERSVNSNTIQTKIVHWKGPPTKGWDATLIEGSGGKHVSIHLDPIHPKAVQSMVVWGGKPVEGWGEHVSIHLDQIQAKGVQSTVVWGGTPVEGWGEKYVSIQPKGVRSTVVWGGTPVEGWGEKHVSTQPKGVQSTVVWGGTPIEGWGEKHVSIHLDQIKPKVMHSKVVWGGTPVEGWGGRDVCIQLDQSHEEGMLQSAIGGGRIQQASHSDPIQTKEAQSLDGWRQWGGGSVSNVSAKHLSVLNQKPIGIRKSSQRSHRPNKRRGPRFRGCGN